MDTSSQDIAQPEGNTYEKTWWVVIPNVLITMKENGGIHISTR